jgi:hypothetical protein
VAKIGHQIPPHQLDPGRLDPPDAEIARRLGAKPDAVFQYRKRHGIPQSPQKWQKLRPPKTRFDWNVVEWRWTNARIAEVLKCSAAAVWYRRRLREAPYSSGLWQKLPPAKPHFAWEKVDWRWPDAKIAQALGCTVSEVRVRRRKHSTP